MPRKKKTENTDIMPLDGLSIPAMPEEDEKGGKGYQLTAKENARFVNHAAGALGYASVNIYDEGEVWERVKLYMQSCEQYYMRPNPAGLANWLGITEQELKDWINEPGTLEHRSAASRIYAMLKQSWADLALTGKTPPSVAMFVAKNWFKMSDVSQIQDEITAKKELDLDKLAAEAAALPDDDII